MLNYATPFGRAGGAAGAGFMGSLGRVLEPLDYARQALWNVPGKIAEGDWGAALPGLLGAGLGAGLAATGVGAPLAILGGSLLGGAAQGVGRATDDERFKAPEASDLIRQLDGDPNSVPGMIGSFALNTLGDPLTYAGFGGGKKLGAAFGKDLENVALTRGPRYPGGAEKLLPGLEEGGMFGQRTQALLDSPHAERILGEIPPGSVPLGKGAEANVFQTPEGGVVRIAGGPTTINVRGVNVPSGPANLDAMLEAKFGGTTAPPPRINAPEVLQAVRDLPIGPYRVEHVPYVDMAAGQVPGMPRPITRAQAEAAIPDLREALIPKGLRDSDLHAGNVGRTKEGNWLVPDAGSVDVPIGRTQPRESITQAQGGRFKNWLLDMLGSDESIRRGIGEGVQNTAGQGIPITPRESIFAPGELPAAARPSELGGGLALSDARASRDRVFNELNDLMQAEGAGSPSVFQANQNRLLEQLQKRQNDVAHFKGSGSPVEMTPLGQMLDELEPSRLRDLLLKPGDLNAADVMAAHRFQRLG